MQKTPIKYCWSLLFISVFLFFLNPFIIALSAFNPSKNKKSKTFFQSQNIVLNDKCFNTNTSQLSTPTFSAQDSLWFQKNEDSLIYYIRRLQTDTIIQNQKINDSLFFRCFLQTLKHPNSYNYNFDKLQDYIYITQAPDSLFKIITWQYSINQLNVQQQGFIQIKTPNNMLKIYPLLDRSHTFFSPLDTIFTSPLWIGALYYTILLNKTKQGKKIYTLLGLDENTIISTKKWIEILTFNDDCQPVFGGDYFLFKPTPIVNTPNTQYSNKQYLQTLNSNNDNEKEKPIQYKRYVIEYSKFITLSLRYDDDLQVIIFDQLIPTEPSAKSRKYSYVLSGDYEGFKWENDKWVYIPKVFDYKLNDGQAPISNPLKFDYNIIPFPQK